MLLFTQAQTFIYYSSAGVCLVSRTACRTTYDFLPPFMAVWLFESEAVLSRRGIRRVARLVPHSHLYHGRTQMYWLSGLNVVSLGVHIDVPQAPTSHAAIDDWPGACHQGLQRGGRTKHKHKHRGTHGPTTYKGHVTACLGVTELALPCSALRMPSIPPDLVTDNDPVV